MYDKTIKKIKDFLDIEGVSNVGITIDEAPKHFGKDHKDYAVVTVEVQYLKRTYLFLYPTKKEEIENAPEAILDVYKAKFERMRKSEDAMAAYENRQKKNRKR